MITIVAATSLRIDQHAIAIERTSTVVPYKVEKLLLSPTAPTVKFSGHWQRLDRWMPDGRWEIGDYGHFIISGLADYVFTDFCITVHWDGYGINREHWTEEFLEYDYIGAPWPPHMTSNAACRVGNGGFSLRSKRWLEAGRAAPAYANEPEDVFCCRKYVNHYRGYGCKIAPIDLALRFSFENQIPEYPDWSIEKSFGFHGWFGDASRDKYKIENEA